MTNTISKILIGVAFTFLFVNFSVHAQDYKPAIEYSSLMNMRFYEADGGFYVDKLQVVFPPKTPQPMWLVITTAAGKIVKSVELATENWTQFPMFDGLRSKGNGMLPLGAPGKYNLVITIGNTPVTVLPFTLNVASNNDPFNPQKTYTRDGLWNVLGFLSLQTDRQDAPLHFNWWSSLREFDGGKEQVSCTVQLMKGDQEIASLASGVVVSSVNWQYFSRRMVQPKSLGGKNLNLSRLTAEDGEYRLILSTNGKPVKTYRVLVKSRALQRLPFCNLNYEPHTNFISPRIIDTSSGSGSSYYMIDAYWVQQVK